MGLLDPKSRVLDVVLTDQGRQAQARNDLRISFFSLSDATAFYSPDVLSGSTDPASRIYSECAGDLPQDAISLFVNDARQVARVRSTALPSSTFAYGGQLTQGVVASVSLTGSGFSAAADAVLSSSLENLRNNFVLGSFDSFFGDEDFVVAPASAEFQLAGSDAAAQTVSVAALEGFFQDPLLSHVPNFMYLPPVIKPTDPQQAPALLGDYSSLGGDVTMGFSDVLAELNAASAAGRLRTFRFDPAPRDNNIHLQIFEQTSSGLGKLDVVDFGTYRGPAGDPVRVLFAGKVFVDDLGVETFARIFTVTLE